MLSKNILFENFTRAKASKKIKQNLKNILSEKNQVLLSLSTEYKNKYNIKKIKKKVFTRIIGMGGSILGSKAIYSFLNNTTNKKFSFIDNLDTNIKSDRQKYFNIIISKSGNTLETISNVNILLKKKIKVFLLLRTKKANYFYLLKNLSHK